MSERASGDRAVSNPPSDARSGPGAKRLAQLDTAWKLGADGASGEWLAGLAGICLDPPQASEWDGGHLTCRRALVPIPDGAAELLLLVDDHEPRLARVPLNREGVRCEPSKHLADEPRTEFSAVQTPLS